MAAYVSLPEGTTHSLLMSQRWSPVANCAAMICMTVMVAAKI
jgi:hypothetical protein